MSATSMGTIQNNSLASNQGIYHKINLQKTNKKKDKIHTDISTTERKKKKNNFFVKRKKNLFYCRES